MYSNAAEISLIHQNAESMVMLKKSLQRDLKTSDKIVVQKNNYYCK